MVSRDSVLGRIAIFVVGLHLAKNSGRTAARNQLLCNRAPVRWRAGAVATQSPACCRHRRKCRGIQEVAVKTALFSLSRIRVWAQLRARVSLHTGRLVTPCSHVVTGRAEVAAGWLAAEFGDTLPNLAP
jgi:hypothetical protein